MTLHDVHQKKTNENSNKIKDNIRRLSYPNNKSQGDFVLQSIRRNSEYAPQRRISIIKLEIESNDKNNIDQNYSQNETHTQKNKIKSKTITKTKIRRRPWFIWIISIVQICVFIGELINSAILTHSPIQTNLTLNPLIGPSMYVLINMGGSFSPCMHSIDGITNYGNLTSFPCPNSTTLKDNNCTLSDLCGFNGVSNNPNQWYRFIISIFLHVGIVHIISNLFTQLILAGYIERKIGVIRMIIIYFTSGIFGFILGGNFSPVGLVRIGCSGSLFGIIALSLLDLFYNWKKKKYPKIQLIIQLIDIIINFVIGLLPGVDNFSHLGGFVIGLLLGLAILGSPIHMRRRIQVKEFNHNINQWHNPRPLRKFFHNRPKKWWIWWLVRFITFALVIVIFVLFTESFYSGRIKCTGCQYINCLPVNGWCDLGKWNITNT